MSAENIRQLSDRAKRMTREDLSKARLILEYAHESAQSLLEAFDEVRTARSEDSGDATEPEQDLLRAMLVFAAAGLDSMVKQLIRDSLSSLVETDEKVRQGLETYVTRQLRGEADEGANRTANKFLARVLISDSHQDQVIKEYINDLTAKSLQSPEELLKASFALGLELTGQEINPNALRPIFGIRNRIIHELDIDFNAPPRHRQQRDREAMVKFTNTLLESCEIIFLGVAAKLDPLIGAA